MARSRVDDTLEINSKCKMLIVFFISLQATAKWLAAETLEILDGPQQNLKINF